MKTLIVFIRKLLYVGFIFLLLSLLSDGDGGEVVFLVGAAIIMQPAKWDRQFINWKKIFGLPEEEDKEKDKQ